MIIRSIKAKLQGLSDTRIRRINLAFLLIMLVYLTIQMGSDTFIKGHMSLPDLKDYRDNYVFSLQVTQELHYYWAFAYPPSFVIVRAEWPWAASLAGPILWMLLILAGAWLAIRACVALSGLRDHPWRYAVASAAFVSCTYFLEWDLQNLNMNLSFLGLLALFGLLMIKADEGGARWAWIAGALLGLTIAMKVYTLCLLPYLILKRRWSMLAAAVLTTVGFCVLFPMWYFGPDWLVVYDSWFETIAGTSTMFFLDNVHAYKLSLYNALLQLRELLGGEQGALADMSKDQAFAAWQVLRAFWIALVCLYFLPQVPAFLQKARPPLQPQRVAADISILVMCALAISGHFKSAQGAALFLPMMLIAGNLTRSGRARWLSAAFLLAGLICTHESPTGPVKGIFVMALMLIMAGVFMAQAWGRGIKTIVREGNRRETML